MTNSFKAKRILAATLAAIMLTMGAAFAEEAETKEDIMLISEEEAVETLTTEGEFTVLTEEAEGETEAAVSEEATEETSEETEAETPKYEIGETPVILLNGVQIEGPAAFWNDGKLFVPVRAISEAIGLTVEWDEATDTVTLVKLPTYITFTTKADGYTFARTAPMLLGSAPILKDWRTFVPVNFIDEILAAKYTVTENGDIDIAYDVDKSVIATVLETGKDDLGNLTINIFDNAMNSEVVLHIAPETVIEDEAGNAVKAEDIKKDDSIKVLYSEAMTMSIPPITNAVKITVLNVAE